MKPPRPRQNDLQNRVVQILSINITQMRDIVALCYPGVERKDRRKYQAAYAAVSRVLRRLHSQGVVSLEHEWETWHGEYNDSHEQTKSGGRWRQVKLNLAGDQPDLTNAKEQREMDGKQRATRQNRESAGRKRKQLTTAKTILISDVKCGLCGGPVTLFGVPDKVWKGLGLDGWVCLSCVAKRLGCEVDHIDEEIRRQRRRFNLKGVNKYCGAKCPRMGVVICEPGPGVPSSVTMDDVTSNRYAATLR